MNGNIRVMSTVAAMTGALVLTAPGHARAGTDELCLPQAYGVPGPQPKHPHWWDAGLTANQRETRWTGSTTIYDGEAIGGDLGSARAIWDGNDDRQYFEFRVAADPELDPLNDVVVLAVTDEAGDPYLYIQIQPMAGCSEAGVPTGVPCDGLGAAIPPSAISYMCADIATGLAWLPCAGDPLGDWVLHHPWVEVQPVGSDWRWTVKFAVETPVAPETQQAWPALKTYGNAIMHIPGATSDLAVEFPLLCQPSMITDDCKITNNGVNDPMASALPDVVRWSAVTTGNNSECEGVELLGQLVGSDFDVTSGFVGGTSVPYELPGRNIPKTDGAHLRAGFHNGTSQTILTQQITATFRIAGWGLQFADWDHATWTEAGTAELEAPVLAGQYAGSLESPLPGALESLLFIPSPTIENDHQCMHVRLEATGGSINFKRDSVYRNMDLVEASVFRRPGDLSMAHRPLPPGDAANDIYLLVHTEAMPTVQECIDSGQALRGCANGGSLELAKPPEVKPIKPQNVKPGEAINKPFDPAPKGVSLDELPKMVVYGFVATGEKVNLPNAPQTPIYDYFSSYGYHVQHKGAPGQGFEHYASIPGAQEVAGAPGLYHLDVAQDEVIAISNTIRVIDGVHNPCAVVPGVDDKMSKAAELLKTQVLDTENKAAPLNEQVQLDAQFGCDAPPNRGSCVEGQCAPHNPIGYIEGSRYVGEWSEAAVKAVYEPEDPDGLAATPGGAQDDIEEDALDDGLTDLPGGVADGCCAEASIEPQASNRGAAGMGAFAMMLLLLRRGRRRRRWD